MAFVHAVQHNHRQLSLKNKQTIKKPTKPAKQPGCVSKVDQGVCVCLLVQLQVPASNTRLWLVISQSFALSCGPRSQFLLIAAAVGIAVVGLSGEKRLTDQGQAVVGWPGFSQYLRFLAVWYCEDDFCVCMSYKVAPRAQSLAMQCLCLLNCRNPLEFNPFPPNQQGLIGTFSHPPVLSFWHFTIE